MKYIMKLENFTNQKLYWRIPTNKQEFFISTSKIGMPKSIQNKFWENQVHSEFNDYIYINHNNLDDYANFKSFTPQQIKEWEWGWMTYEDGENYYKKHKYVSMKDIEITPDDIEKYKMEEMANKYNII